ncbi:MAG: cupin-like domain-containing protein [Oscillatoriales cyanobacterium]|nr:MAG: cupin-like domain-containing protein [Oscillatoriales cyanobacterium]TAH16107.1 MAG: cupin-like domain-containing protein [Oscillatoriales cyanobacterium]
MEIMPDEEFNILAALRALDTIDESESRALEEKLQESPELESELDAFETAVGAIAYTAPLVPVSPNLKHRLFQRIAELSPTPIEEINAQPVIPAAENNTPSVIVRSQNVKWRKYTVSGISFANLYVDREKREFTCLMRLEAGVEFPLHRHGGVEEVFMLEGDLEVEGEICYPGDYIRSFPNSIHGPVSHNGCLLLVKSSLDNEMIVC